MRLHDVAELEVAELVRQHRLDLAGRQPGEQGVEEDDALGRAEAGEVGVGVRRAAAAVHHEQALGGEAGSAPSAPATRAFSEASSSGSNLLKSGAMTVGTSTSAIRLKAIQAPQAQSHHERPARRP